MLTAEGTAATNFTGVTDVLDAQDYIVYSTPKSFQVLERAFGEFDRRTQPEFVRCLLSDANLAVVGTLRSAMCTDVHFLELTTALIDRCHSFVDEAKMKVCILG